MCIEEGKKKMYEKIIVDRCDSRSSEVELLLQLLR